MKNDDINYVTDVEVIHNQRVRFYLVFQYNSKKKKTKHYNLVPSAQT